MTSQKQKLGAWGETLALAFLKERGDILLAQNYRTEHGELDLVTRRGDRIVFTEVKTRRSDSYGPPEAAISDSKRAHLIASAQTFLQALPGYRGDWQIDVIAIAVHPDRTPLLKHIENAIIG